MTKDRASHSPCDRMDAFPVHANEYSTENTTCALWMMVCASEAASRIRIPT